MKLACINCGKTECNCFSEIFREANKLEGMRHRHARKMTMDKVGEYKKQGMKHCSFCGQWHYENNCGKEEVLEALKK